MIRKIPPKTICAEFLLVYELEGAQKAIDLLAKYYKIKKMKIILDGRKVGKKYLACYQDNKSYFKKKNLKKKIILHEFYHHLVSNKKIVPEKEEREANDFATMILNRFKDKIRV
jgi:hypothetical protein